MFIRFRSQDSWWDHDEGSTSLFCKMFRNEFFSIIIISSTFQSLKKLWMSCIRTRFANASRNKIRYEVIQKIIFFIFHCAGVLKWISPPPFYWDTHRKNWSEIGPAFEKPPNFTFMQKPTCTAAFGNYSTPSSSRFYILSTSSSVFDVQWWRRREKVVRYRLRQRQYVLNLSPSSASNLWLGGN